MPIVITKTEDRQKPITFLSNIQAQWITLADRAANWTPWARKTDTETEANMAGEYIQAIIAPLDGDPEKLRAILGEEGFKRWGAAKAEKFDTVEKRELLPMDSFSALDVKDLGEGFKAAFGQLRSGVAEKMDTDTLVKMPAQPEANMPMGVMPAGGDNYQRFRSLLNDKFRILQGGVLAAVEFNEDPEAIRAQVDDAFAGFSNWLNGAIVELQAAQATKADTDPPPRPKLSTRMRNFLGLSTGPGPDNATANKGDKTMTPEEIRELAVLAAKEAAQTTVQEMVMKADTEEAEKAKREAAEKADAEKADFKAKLEETLARQDKILAKLEEAEAKKTDADADAKKQLEDLEKTQAELQAQLTETATKMDALRRSPGAPASPEDKYKIQPGDMPAEKSDIPPELECFNVPIQ